MNPERSSDLCLECGLCCNGVLFVDGELLTEDNAPRLQQLGLKVFENSKSKFVTRKFAQPCAVFDGCRCGIYSERPMYCRQFECLLLKSVKNGHTPKAEAAKVIQQARKRAGNVKRLLRELGDDDDDVPLSTRFRRVKRRIETREADANALERFGELTLAVHDLNLLLSSAFYPGEE